MWTSLKQKPWTKCFWRNGLVADHVPCPWDRSSYLADVAENNTLIKSTFHFVTETKFNILKRKFFIDLRTYGLRINELMYIS